MLSGGAESGGKAVEIAICSLSLVGGPFQPLKLELVRAARVKVYVLL